ncbi:MAG TPA: hypothetical protein VK846_00220 [Candidatus Limnocylindria bacterium]|nr:hypothetical protein [Candidatus Limnocylindria bacterium]
MKTATMFLLGLLCAGCTSPKEVADLRGNGTCKTFDAPRADVWRAAINACRFGGLQIEGFDAERGYIAAKTPVRMESWGEYVGVWVEAKSTNQTEVEVVSRRRSEPRGLFHYDWEQPILISIGAELSAEPKTQVQPLR